MADERTLQQRKLESAAKTRKTSIDGAIAANIATPAGRRFLWWLLEIGKVGLQPFSREAIITAFNCGELNVGQQILARLIEVSPEGYLLMMKENEIERSTLGTEPDSSDPGSSTGGDSAGS